MGEVHQLPPPKSRALVPAAPRPAHRLTLMMPKRIRTDRTLDGRGWIIHGHRFTCGMPFRLEA